jgi:hypothetical protein
MNTLYIYIFSAIVVVLWTPVIIEVYLLKKLLKSIAKKTEKLVE